MSDTFESKTSQPHHRCRNQSIGCPYARFRGFWRSSEYYRRRTLFLEKHQIIWKALLHLYGQGISIDLVALSTVLEEQAKLQFIGGKRLFVFFDRVGGLFGKYHVARRTRPKQVYFKTIDFYFSRYYPFGPRPLQTQKKCSRNRKANF